MQTNQEWIDENDENIDEDVEQDGDEDGDAPRPSIMEKLSEWLEQVFESGADLEAELERAVFIELFSLLQEAGRDEPRRYKAIAEMLKFAKWMEQKRTRQDRTAVQNRRLDILQTAQEIKPRPMGMTSQPPEKSQKPESQKSKAPQPKSQEAISQKAISKEAITKEAEPPQAQNATQEPTTQENTDQKPTPPEPVPPGITQEPPKLEQPLPPQPEQPQREASREVEAPPAAKTTPERFQARRPKVAAPLAALGRRGRKHAALRSSPVPPWVLRGKRRKR